MKESELPEATGAFPWALLGFGSNLQEWDLAAPAALAELGVPGLGQEALKEVLGIREQALMLWTMIL